MWHMRRVPARQRAGCAGRTRPGKCFRLYTQQYYERQKPVAMVPEIQRTSMLLAVSHLKSLALDVYILALVCVPPGHAFRDVTVVRATLFPC